MIFEAVAQDKNIVNVDTDIFSKFFMEEILNNSDKGDWHIHVFLHHDIASE